MSSDTVTGGVLERHAELAELRDVIAGARSGVGSVVVVEGPAGIGKSRLLAAALEQAADARVLQARGSEFDCHSPYLVAAQLFGTAAAKASDEDRDRLFAGQARLAAPLFDGALRADADGEGVLRGLFWLTANLVAPSGPGAHTAVLLILDDAQWADRASLRFVLHLAARVDGLPVAVVIAIRTGEADEAMDLLDAVRALPHARVLRPAPLSPAAVAEVVEQSLAGAAPTFVQACARVTGGNPFLVHELIHALSADHVSPTDDSVAAVERLVPASVARAVLVRLARLPPSAQKLAVAVAILGAPVSLAGAAALAGMPVDAAEQAADSLALAHVLTAGEPLSFTHPLIGTAVYADIPAFARSRAHRRAAQLLAAEQAPGQKIAAHLLLTRPEGDPASLRTLRAAAEQARRQGEPKAAARLLRRAQAELRTGPDRFDLLLELAQAEADGGEHGAAKHVEEALRMADSPSDTARALAVRARICYAEGDHAGTLQATEAALDHLDGDDPTAQALLADFLGAGTFHAPSRTRVRPRMASLVQAARDGRLPTDPSLLAHVALQFALAGEPAVRVRAVADRALAADPLVDRTAHGMGLSLVIQALGCVDELAAAETAATNAISSARQRGSVLAYALASYHRAIPRYHRGALIDALADIDQVRLVREDGWVGADGWTAQLSTLLHLARGDLAAARRSIELGAAVPRDSIDYPVELYGRAQLALADGQPVAALNAARKAGHLLATDFGIDHPGLFPWRCTAALAAHRLDDSHQADQLAQEAVDQARELGVPRPLAHALRTAAYLAPDRHAVQILTEAEALLHCSPALLEHAATLIDLGTRQRLTGDTASALRTLRRGYAQADTLQATALINQARRQLHVLGARPRRAALSGVQALTPTERRVADLASTARTNAQIAQALFVTPKTVETHLANAYRKLGITTRHQLPAALGTRNADDSRGGASQ
jgi:DNA-binding CsgD family transcriptional regulator